MDRAELARLLAAHVEATGVAGASVAILSDGEIVEASAGVADIAAGAPVAAGTRFPIASITKPMVATAIAVLAERGSIAFDDPIAAHVPELAETEWAHRATIDHLPSNTSGVALRSAIEFGFDDREDRALARFCEAVAIERPVGRPGDVWSYCNTGWSVLGRAIETITGADWPTAMSRLVFEPFGMTATGAEVTDHDVNRYEIVNGTPVEAPSWRSPALGPGGGLLSSTAADLIRFAMPHVYDERARFARLREPTAAIDIWPWMEDWCRGWARFTWDGGPVWGWDGVTNGARAQLRLVPSAEGAIALLCNSGRGRALYWSLMPELLRRCYDVTMPGPRTVVSLDTDLQPFAGTYAWPDSTLVVEAKDDRLTVDSGTRSMEAFPTDERTFLLQAPAPDPLTITFERFDETGRPSLLYWLVWGYPRIETQQ